MLSLLRTLLVLAAQPAIGGQAVIEGVMMRSPRSFAVAVRRPDGSIVVREEAWLSFSERFRFLKWPLLRGANMLIESMVNGLSALNFSAREAMPEDDGQAPTPPPTSGTLTHALSTQALSTQALVAPLGLACAAPSGDDGASAPSDERRSLSLWLTLLVSIGFAMALFKGVPHLATWGLGELLGRGDGNALPVTSAWFHLVDGAVRMLVFAGYILLISRLPDVKRLFMYHGAEHKSVHAFERRLPLDVASARVQSTAHPRCGTSLILLVIAVSVFVFAAVIPLLPTVSEHSLVQALFALAIKIPLLLPVAGLAYEAQRLAAKHPNNAVVRALIAPGMLMQRLTTREPTDPELEVALTALRKAWWREQLAGRQEVAEATPSERRATTIEVFSGFDEVLEKMAPAEKMAA